MKFAFKIIWVLSEMTGIGLGRYALYVFEKMIGIKGDLITPNPHD